ncbi:hypothetical protein [Nonomuraea sp. NPDC003804]|uniref:hypothetical protein n=1 Tax=Nonomuraea sp. NPDC003804 TaxID=3154547 RepID=UPI0033A9E331
MRRWIATTAITLALSPVVAGSGPSAHARIAPLDPVGALKRQLVENRGVKMSNVHTTTVEGERVKFWEKGVAQFGKEKIISTDITFDSEVRWNPERIITFTGRSYRKDKTLARVKGWLLDENKAIRPALKAGWIEIANPVALKAVLATTKVKRPAGVYDGTRTTLHQGTITFGELHKASLAFPFGLDGKPRGRDAEIKVAWKLWLGEDQLVRRAVGTWRRTSRDRGETTYSYVFDTRVTGWGTKTHITPPPADEVVTWEDLGKPSPEAPSPPSLSGE